MSLVTERMFTDTIAVAVKSSRDGHGFAAYGADTNYTGRVKYKRTMSRQGGQQADGEQLISKITVLITPDYTPAATDRITLPDATKPRLLWFEEALDQHNETHHWKLFLE